MEFTQLIEILHDKLDTRDGCYVVDDLILKHDVKQSFKNFKINCKNLPKTYLHTTLKLSYGHFFRSYNGPDYELNCEFIKTLLKAYFNSIYLDDTLNI